MSSVAYCNQDLSPGKSYVLGYFQGLLSSRELISEEKIYGWQGWLYRDQKWGVLQYYYLNLLLRNKIVVVQFVSAAWIQDEHDSTLLLVNHSKNKNYKIQAQELLLLQLFSLRRWPLIL